MFSVKAEETGPVQQSLSNNVLKKEREKKKVK